MAEQSRKIVPTRETPENAKDKPDAEPECSSGTLPTATDEDAFADGLVALFSPLIQSLDERIRATRISQLQLNEQITLLSDDVRVISDTYHTPFELDGYVQKLAEVKKRVAVVSSILSNAHLAACTKPWLTANTRRNDALKLIGIFTIAQCMGLVTWLMLSIRLPGSMPAVGITVGVSTMAITIAMLMWPRFLELVIVSFPLMITRHLSDVLLMLIILWALQGPATNMDENQVSLLRAMDCVQQKVANERKEAGGMAANALLEKFPFIKAAQLQLKELTHRIRKEMRIFHELIVRLAAKIKNGFMWLERLSFNLSCKMSLSPYWLCSRIFVEFEAGCRDVMGIFGFMCSVVKWISKICTVSKTLQEAVVKACGLPGYLGDKIKQHVFDRIEKAIVDVAKKIDGDMYFELHLERKYDADFDIVSNLTVVVQSMVEKWEAATSFYRQLKHIIAMLIEISLLPMLFLLPILFSCIYRRLYLRSDMLENYFETPAFVAIDRRRAMADMDTLLPLGLSESSKCIKPCRPRPAGVEWAILVRRWCCVTVLLLPPFAFIVGDIVLYEFYSELHYYFNNQSIAEDVPPFFTIDISGNGTIAAVMRNFLTSIVALQEPEAAVDQWKECFEEEPSEPDYDLITKIKEKAPVIRDKLKAYGRGVKVEGKLGRLANKLLPFTITARQYCCVCSVAGAMSDSDNFAQCANEKCRSSYCIQCYNRRQTCRCCGLKLTSKRTSITNEIDSSMSESELEDLAL